MDLIGVCRAEVYSARNLIAIYVNKYSYEPHCQSPLESSIRQETSLKDDNPSQRKSSSTETVLPFFPKLFCLLPLFFLRFRVVACLFFSLFSLFLLIGWLETGCVTLPQLPVKRPANLTLRRTVRDLISVLTFSNLNDLATWLFNSDFCFETFLRPLLDSLVIQRTLWNL